MPQAINFFAIDPMSAAIAEARVRRLMESPAAAFVMGQEQEQPPAPRKPYQTMGGVAVVSVRGLIVAQGIWYDETDAGRVGAALKQAAADSDVSSILLAVDSPGGEVVPTVGLADTVAAVNAIKPITAHVNGTGASAAYWIASQTSSIAASRMARVGSIGVIQVIYDTSEAAKAEGVRPVVITTAPLKATGVPGVPVTDEMVAESQAVVDGYMAAFVAAIKSGRGIDPKAVSTGGTWFAKEAKALGLIDKIASFDETLTAMIEKNNASAKARTAKARAGMAFME
jgi:signal peptide peptidase SppA